MTSRELVKKTLEFQNETGRVPRHKWVLKWAENTYPEFYRYLQETFPDDIVGAPAAYIEQPPETGDPFEIGEYVDCWGCRFENIHRGIIGEVKHPLIRDEDWNDADDFRFPNELLTVDTQAVNAFCAGTDQFVLSALSPRPFERLQFLRGTEDLYVDLMLKPPKMLTFMHRMHDFYCEMLTKWAQTDVDAIKFMDDWGAQRSLLISHSLWSEYFRPMYKDYIDIAKKYNKKIFMHSDGNILEIIPDLIDMGLDALNCQVFCMGVEHLKPFAGHITFWGEVDRQHILPSGTTQEVEAAVSSLYDTFWKNGGAIAQCEFGPGAKPENIERVFSVWNQKNKERRNKA